MMTKKLENEDIIRTILRHWWLIALTTLLAVFATIHATTQWMDKTYEATVSMFLAREMENPGNLTYSDLVLNATAVADYRSLAESQAVAAEVIKTLDLDKHPLNIVENLAVFTVADSRYFSITYTDTDPVLTAKIVNVLADTLVSRMEELIRVKNATVVAYATPPEYPSSPSLLINAAAGMLFGLLSGVLIALVREKLNVTILSAKDLKAMPSIQVLGEIPYYQSRGE